MSAFTKVFSPGVEKEFPNLRGYADVADVGQAAKDWPQLNFIIYHSAYRHVGGDPKVALAEFERTSRLSWTSDLADIPAQYGVSNVYGDVGQLFATTLVAEPNVCAALMGTLIKGLGADHICWGTDALWTGAPQWQIEGLRRLEIPEDMQKKFGYAPLGPADGPVKTAIFGDNNARLYGIQPKRAMLELKGDRFALMKAKYEKAGAEPSHRPPGVCVKPRDVIGRQRVGAKRRPVWLLAMTMWRLFSLELRFAFLAERLDAFPEIVALADGIEQPAHLGDRLQRSLRHDIARELLQGLHDQRRVGGDLRRHFLRLHDMLSLRRYPVHKADLIRALDRQLLADQQEFHGDLVRHARHHRRDAAGGGPDFCFGIGEARGLRRDAHVGHLHEHEAAADHPAGGCGNHRLVQFDAEPRHGVPHVHREILHVGADRKIGVLGGGKHRNAIVAVAKGEPRLAQLFAQRAVQRVMFLATIHGNGGDALGTLVADQGHGFPHAAFS